MNIVNCALSLNIMIYFIKLNIFCCYPFLFSLLALGMVDINGTHLIGKY